MRLLAIILVGACSLLVACKKERTIHITAKNAVTGVPYSGLTYYVVQEMTSGDGEKTKTVATGTLDGNGEAHLTKKLPKAYSYTVRVEAPANTCYNKQIAFHFANQETAFECAFEFAECAYMRQNIVNVNCEGPTDVFNVRDRFTYTEWSGWSIDLLGCYSNTGGDYFKVPAGKRFFQWKVSRPSGIVEHIDSIELAPGEYGDLNINY